MHQNTPMIKRLTTTLFKYVPGAAPIVLFCFFFFFTIVKFAEVGLDTPEKHLEPIMSPQNSVTNNNYFVFFFSSENPPAPARKDPEPMAVPQHR